MAPTTASPTRSQIHQSLESPESTAGTVVVVVGGTVVDVVVVEVEVVVVDEVVDEVVVAGTVVGAAVVSVVTGVVVVTGGIVGREGRVVGVDVLVGTSGRIVVGVDVDATSLVVLAADVLGRVKLGALTVGRVPPPGREPPELLHAAATATKPSRMHTVRRVQLPVIPLMET